MNIWVTMVLAGLATYLTRLSFIWLLGKWEMPHWLKRVLRYVPPAVLTAIIFPELFMQSGALVLLPDRNPRWIAGLIAALVAWRTRSVMLTIVAGMAVLWLMQAVL